MIIRHTLLILSLLWPAAAVAQPQANPLQAQDSPPAPPPQTWRQMVGFDAAYQRLRMDLPLGRNVAVGYVEGSMNGGYAPDANDKRLAGVTVVMHSGQAPASGHATYGASVAFGPGGIAPGVKVINSFLAASFLTDGCLNVGKAEPPRDTGLQLFNHSWISAASPMAMHALRRVDWLIDQHDVVMCAGVNNGRDSTVPALLCSAYNIIAVGTASGGGDSSGGYTRIEVSGRCKPDIVGPRELTSFSTSAVTGCCAMLLERAGTMDDPRARMSETIKAVLLAGAVKTDRWSPAAGKPLDEHLGAGVVNVDRALAALDAGPIHGAHLLRPFGWDLVTLGADQQRSYRFETARPWCDATFVIVWNRRIDGRVAKLFGGNEDVWLDVPRVANFDLLLHRYEDDGTSQQLAASISQVDNVELIHLRQLPAGRYRLELVRRQDAFDESWDVALAWWMAPPPESPQPPQPLPAEVDSLPQQGMSPAP
ncbi:MAG: hypothetical protein IT445_15225 [Phycisphaeraceae bacterium]|nr:hypothetical protein [Phycisphaeraceae bacterium]